MGEHGEGRTVPTDHKPGEPVAHLDAGLGESTAATPAHLWVRTRLANPLARMTERGTFGQLFGSRLLGFVCNPTLGITKCVKVHVCVCHHVYVCVWVCVSVRCLCEYMCVCRCGCVLEWAWASECLYVCLCVCVCV